MKKLRDLKSAFLIFRCLFIALSLIISQPLSANDMDIHVEDEISYLLECIKKSTCTFQRNGKWFKPADAAEHINKKYLYFLKQGKIKTAEDFIQYAATKSSISGKAYTVQCQEGNFLESAEWLTAALVQMRARQSNP
jgi:hypothetical protein